MSPTIDTAMSSNLSTTNNITSLFQEMLDDIRMIFSQPDGMIDVDELWRVLDSYKSNPSDWAKFAYYDKRKYKRNLVDGQENYNVMIICWDTNTRSCIHDHSGSHCFMKILDGELIESRFAWPDENSMQNEGEGQEMRSFSEAKMHLNDVLYINDKVGLHRVENPSTKKTSASLHVYIPPIKECKAFDQRTGQAKKCKLTFFSKRGKIIREDELK